MSPERIERAGAAASLWRDAPSQDGARTAAIGEFSCADAQAGAVLLREAADLLAGEGFARVLGPMDGDTWGPHRLVTESDGSAPFLMEPHNPPHYPHAFEAAGFGVAARYFSASRPTDAPVEAEAPVAGLALRGFDRADADAELARLHELALTAFAGNAFYKPISRERFLAAYLPVIPLLDLDLVLLVEDKRRALAGFLFAIPDFAEGAAPRSVILKTYASRRPGVGGWMARVFHRRVRERGYKRVIHALMHESNVSARHSEKLGAHVFRRYALWSKPL